MRRLKILLKDKRLRAEYLKSIAVGVFCAFLEFFVLSLFLYFDSSAEHSSLLDVFSHSNSVKQNGDRTVAVVLGTGVGFALSFLLNYILSVFFVYYYGNVGRNKKGFAKFLLFAATGFTVNTLGQFIGYNLLGINLWIIKVVLVLILFVFNFFTRKYYIFNINLIIDKDNQIEL